MRKSTALMLGLLGVGATYGIYRRTVPQHYTKPQGESALEKQFYEHASVYEDGQWQMSKEDFYRACGIHPWEVNLENHSSAWAALQQRWHQRQSALRLSHEQSRLDLKEVTDLFERLSNDAERVAWPEFKRFGQLLRSANADQRTIFLLSDLTQDHTVSLAEFQRGLREYVPAFAQAHPEQLELGTSELLRRHFGKEGTRRLEWDEYHKLMEELEDVLLRHDFDHLADASGTVPTGRLSEHLIQKSKSGVLPAHVLANLHRLQQEAGRPTITWEQFRALHRFLLHIQTVESCLKRHQPQEGYTQAEFQQLLQKEHALRLSDTELQWVFTLLANPESQRLDQSSVEALTRNLHEDAPDAPKMKFYQSLALGGVSAMLGVTCVFPLDKVKTRMQSSSGQQGLWSTLRRIVKEEGAHKLYRGLQAELVGITPEKAVKITVNDFLRKRMLQRHQTESGEKRVQLSVWEEMLAGMGCGMVQVFVSNPVSVVKIRLQMQESGKPTERPWDIVRKLGPRGLYTGLSASIMRDIPFSMVYFSLYQGMKAHLKNEKARTAGASPDLTASELLLVSCVAGSVAGAVDTPADAVKTRLQNGQGKYKGIVDCFRTVWAEEGIRGLFRGLTARVLIISPFFGITMMSYEMLQRYFFPHSQTGLSLLDEDFTTIRRSRLQHLDSQLQMRYLV